MPPANWWRRQMPLPAPAPPWCGPSPDRLTQPWDRFGRWLKSVMPKGLYARSLLIIIVPMVVLQSVVALLFLERHWNLVTNYLSSAVTQEIATLIDVYKTYPQDADHAQLRRIAQDRLGLVVDFMPGGQLPPPGPKPFFNQLDAALSDRHPQADRPAVLDRHGRPLLDRGNPHPASRHDHARLRAARRRLRSEFVDLPGLDGRDLARRAGHRDRVPAQPDQADRAARRRRRGVRQGPRGAEFPATRCARGAPRGGRVSGNEGPRRARHRAAHHHAGRRLARSAHHPDPLQARTGVARRRPGNRGHQEGHRRDGGDARGLSCLRPRRHRRAIGADRYRRAARRAQARYRAPRPCAPA